MCEVVVIINKSDRTTLERGASIGLTIGLMLMAGTTLIIIMGGSLNNLAC